MSKFIVVTEEVGNSPFKQFKFEEVGTSLPILLMSLGDATSPEYGDFVVLQGLQFNPEAKSLDELIETAQLVSFPNQTVLNNKIQSGAMRLREPYIITLKWKKGDKYDNGKKVCKSNGYEVVHVVFKDDVKEKLIERYHQLLGENESLVAATVPVDESVETDSKSVYEPKL